jgi:hypothetical protein
MDGELLDRLARAGVGTPKALCDADVLDLAGRGVGGYTRLLHLQFLARRGGLEAPAPGPRAPQAPSSGAGPSAAEVSPDVDLIVPVRPPDRRAGAGRSAPTVEVPILRFSPRGEPPAAVRAVLEAELERFAAREVDGPAPGSEALPLEDAGSSGPFA